MHDRNCTGLYRKLSILLCLTQLFSLPIVTTLRSDAGESESAGLILSVLSAAVQDRYSKRIVDLNGDGLPTVKDLSYALLFEAGMVMPSVFQATMEPIQMQFKQNKVALSSDDPSGKEGTLAAYARWVSTDYLPVGDHYAYRYQLAGHRYLLSVAYYDKNKSYLEGVGTKSCTGCATLRGVSLVPEGAAYVRFINFVGDGYPVAFQEPEVYALPTEKDYCLYLQSHPYIDYRIACLGDSLTEGDYGKIVGAACVHYRNYPWFLSEKLGCETVNYGRCGITVDEFYTLYHSGKVDITQADLILIMLGTNLGITTTGRKKKYRQLIQEIEKDKKPDAIVVLLTPPHATLDPAKPNYGYGDAVDSAVEFVRQLSVENELPLIDVFSDSPIQAEHEDRFQPYDGLHMGEDGYRELADFLATRLTTLDPRLSKAKKSD